MDVVIPEAWRELNTTERDILVTLAVGGPASGATIHARRGKPERNVSVTNKYLQPLREAGYVETSGGPGQETENRLTGAGAQLVRDAIVRPARKMYVDLKRDA